MFSWFGNNIFLFSILLLLVILFLPPLYRFVRRWSFRGTLTPFSNIGDEASWLCPFFSWWTYGIFPRSVHLKLKKRNDTFALIASNKQTIEVTTSNNKWFLCNETFSPPFVTPIIVKDFYTNNVLAQFDIARDGCVKIEGSSTYRWRTRVEHHYIFLPFLIGQFEDKDGNKVLEISVRRFSWEKISGCSCYPLRFFNCPEKDKELLAVLAGFLFVGLENVPQGSA